jgi:hypothetical protein
MQKQKYKSHSTNTHNIKMYVCVCVYKQNNKYLDFTSNTFFLNSCFPSWLAEFIGTVAQEQTTTYSKWYIRRMDKWVTWKGGINKQYMNYMNNNQHYALFFFSLLSYHTSTCFGHISSPSSGGRMYTECPRRKGPIFGRVFLRSNYTDITQNTYIPSSMVMEILTREVWNFDSYYSLIDYQIHIEADRNVWFL